MSLKNLILITIIIALSTLMTKVKTTNLRLHDIKYANKPEHHKFHYHNFQTRHHNHFHKKHHKCNLDRFYNEPNGYAKKQSRYPTLDKIVNRLDNQIDRGFSKLKLTTPNPFENWNLSLPEPTEFSDKRNKYSYVTVGLKNNSGLMKNLKKGYNKKDYFKDDWMDEEMDIKLSEGDDNNINFDENSKGYMQDFTTPSPWDNEQHDISSQTEGSTKELSSTTSSSVSTSTTTTKTISLLRSSFNKENEEKKFKNLDDKLSSWSFARLIPRFTEEEDKKKKTTPMPYVAAHEHYEQVVRMGDCHVPKKKVIRVHEVHPDPSKSYSPSCTILHQCGDDTGCCRDLKQVCKPKNTTKVELYFFTTTLGKPQTVEKLYFVNHTECECQRRTDESMPRDSEFRRSHLKKYFNQNGNEKKKKRNNCTCPSKYSTRYLQNGTCICDCFDKQDDCLILKKGKTHFTYNDKLCIQQGDCLPPTCEFGSYIKQFGRCPNRSENYYYSWSRGYRDLIT